MSAHVFYVPDHDFREEVLRASIVKELLDGIAREGAEIYRDGVPVDEGDLRDSVFGDVVLTADGYQGRIGATDWKAALVEFGTSIRSPDGSLRRAMEAIGVVFEAAHETG